MRLLYKIARWLHEKEIFGEVGGFPRATFSEMAADFQADYPGVQRKKLSEKWREHLSDPLLVWKPQHLEAIVALHEEGSSPSSLVLLPSPPPHSSPLALLLLPLILRALPSPSSPRPFQILSVLLLLSLSHPPHLLFSLVLSPADICDHLYDNFDLVLMPYVVQQVLQLLEDRGNQALVQLQGKRIRFDVQ